jgi:hypothetical protein
LSGKASKSCNEKGDLGGNPDLLDIAGRQQSFPSTDIGKVAVAKPENK